MRFAHYFSSLTLTLTLGLAGCSGGSGTTTPGPTTPLAGSVTPAAEEATEPVLKTVAARSKARWDTIVAGDWIQAYDFMTPGRKAQESLGMYLRNKDNHEYKNPSEPRVLGGEKDEAYVEISVLWTPHHAELKDADNYEPLTKQLDLIETWTWEGQEWFWVRTERQREFLAKHPNIGD